MLLARRSSLRGGRTTQRVVPLARLGESRDFLDSVTVLGSSPEKNLQSEFSPARCPIKKVTNTVLDALVISPLVVGPFTAAFVPLAESSRE